jgi:hypothetical protein
LWIRHRSAVVGLCRSAENVFSRQAENGHGSVALSRVSFRVVRVFCGKFPLSSSSAVHVFRR